MFFTTITDNPESSLKSKSVYLKSSNSNGRIYGLDILRAIAILLVIYVHASNYFPGRSFYILGDGVTVFFVLSGFLIGKILFRTIDKGLGRYELIKFWYRRWLRTLPAYFAVITLVMLYTHKFYPSYYTFSQNIFSGDLKFYGESWSLSVEEWFYLLVPIIFFLTAQFSKTEYLFFWIISIILGVSFYRVLLTDTNMTIEVFDSVIRKAVTTRMDSIMYGVLAAYIFTYKPSIWTRLKVLFPIGLVLWTITIFNRNFFGFNTFSIYCTLSMQSIATFCVIPFLSNLKSGKGIVFKSFTFVSMISYSMYLLSGTPASLILQIDRIQSYTRSSSWFSLIIYLLISFFGAYLLYRCIEKPFMNLRDWKIRMFTSKVSRY